MKDRLTNPKSLNIDLDNLEIITFNESNYRVFNQKITEIDNGSCQCNKDCDCSSNRGKVTTKEIIWYRDVAFDGTDKCFYSKLPS